MNVFWVVDFGRGFFSRSRSVKLIKKKKYVFLTKVEDNCTCFQHPWWPVGVKWSADHFWSLPSSCFGNYFLWSEKKRPAHPWPFDETQISYRGRGPLLQKMAAHYYNTEHVHPYSWDQVCSVTIDGVLGRHFLSSQCPSNTLALVGPITPQWAPFTPQ